MGFKAWSSFDLQEKQYAAIVGGIGVATLSLIGAGIAGAAATVTKPTAPLKISAKAAAPVKTVSEAYKDFNRDSFTIDGVLLKDGSEMGCEVTVTYRLDEKAIANLKRNFSGAMQFHKVIKEETANYVKTNGSDFLSAQDFYNRLRPTGNHAATYLNDWLKQNGLPEINCSVRLHNPEVSAEYEGQKDALRHVRDEAEYLKMLREGGLIIAAPYSSGGKREPELQRVKGPQPL